MGACVSCGFYCKKLMKQIVDGPDSTDPEEKSPLLDTSMESHPGIATPVKPNSTYVKSIESQNDLLSSKVNPSSGDLSNSINLAFDFGTAFNSFGFLLQLGSATEGLFFCFLSNIFGFIVYVSIQRCFI